LEVDPIKEEEESGGDKLSSAKLPHNEMTFQPSELLMVSAQNDLSR
jgi:hypothetical protein